jgi:hypothetical protein
VGRGGKNKPASRGIAGEDEMDKHPNEFTRLQIARFFKTHHVEADVTIVERGYVIFFHFFSAIEGKRIKDPAGRLLFHEEQDDWMLFWMSGKNRWYPYDRYGRLHEALMEMCSEHAAHLFKKAL